MMPSLLRWAIRGYQLVVSPLLGPRCRYFPSCSQYAVEAIERHGALTGLRLAVLRVARCHPWGASGVDPVPDQAPSKFSWFKFSRATCGQCLSKQSGSSAAGLRRELGATGWPPALHSPLDDSTNN